MHERLIIDASFINTVIPTMRTKYELAGKRLYFWNNGTIDDIAVLAFNRKTDSLNVYVKSTKASGFSPIAPKIKEEIDKLVPPKAISDYRFIYDMEGKELLYNLTDSTQISWFYSYPPGKVIINKQYLVLWNDISVDGKNTVQKVFKLAQDGDNLVALSTFMNKSDSLIFTGEPTQAGLDYSFLLTAHTFGLPLRTSTNTNLKAFCETYKRGEKKLDIERVHENFEDIVFKITSAEEEKKKQKKEIVGGREKPGCKSFSLNELLIDGFPSAIDAEIRMDSHSQKGFPVQISNAHIASGYLFLYAEEDISDYQESLKMFRNIFEHEQIILIDLYDNEYEEMRGWLH